MPKGEDLPSSMAAVSGPEKRRSPTAEDEARPHPTICVWELTLQCDLGCRHCGSRAGLPRAGELTTLECMDTVRQLADLGVREVALIGGEAYLRNDWHLIAAEITRQGMDCTMTTGARQLNDTRVAQAVESGIKSISISIDGLEATHDALRGVEGSWRAAVEASRRIAATPIRLTTNTQINRLSMPELPALADVLSDIKSEAWQIQLTVAMGRAGDRPDLLLQPYELLELFPLLVWIEQTKLTPNGIDLFPGNNVGYFGPWPLRTGAGNQSSAGWNGCSAGLWGIGLEADGKIKGCPSLQSVPYTGGNIRRDKLRTVVEQSPELRLLRERTREDLWGFCYTCEHADICKAGCSWTSHSLFGRPGNNPYCIHRAIELEKSGKRERVALAEMPPGVPFDNGRYDLIEEDIPAGEAAAAIAGVDPALVITASRTTQGLSDKSRMKSVLQRGSVEGFPS